MGFLLTASLKRISDGSWSKFNSKSCEFSIFRKFQITMRVPRSSIWSNSTSMCFMPWNGECSTRHVDTWNVYINAANTHREWLSNCFAWTSLLSSHPWTIGPQSVQTTTPSERELLLHVYSREMCVTTCPHSLSSHLLWTRLHRFPFSLSLDGRKRVRRMEFYHDKIQKNDSLPLLNPLPYRPISPSCFVQWPKDNILWSVL